MLTPGTILQDRYVIVELLAEGGMGEVYRAEFTNLRGRFVAVKASKIDPGNELLRRQFEREAGLLFDLKHGALPKVFDLWADERGQFLVMEFIDGRDLSRVLRDTGRPIDLTTAMRWADQLLDALEYLHARTPPVIHRDIKPQNIKLTADGRVVLLDFGLAKATGSLHSMTTASIVGHTPEYAPIEQVHGEGTDERSDIYSLAATLYTLLAYQAPARATVRASAALEGRPDPIVPLCELNASVPVPVWEAIRAGLGLMREARPHSAHAFRRMLRSGLQGTGILPLLEAQAADDPYATMADHTASLWTSSTNPQAGPAAGSSGRERGFARPTVEQSGGGRQTEVAQPAADTRLSPEAFARTEIDTGGADRSYGPLPGDTKLSTASLADQTIVDEAFRERPTAIMPGGGGRAPADLPPREEFVTRYSIDSVPRDAPTMAGFAKDAPTVPMAKAAGPATSAAPPPRTSPVTPPAPLPPPVRVESSGAGFVTDARTAPTDHLSAGGGAAARASTQPTVAAPERDAGVRRSGTGLWIGVSVLLIAGLAAGGYVMWGRYVRPAPVPEVPVAEMPAPAPSAGTPSTPAAPPAPAAPVDLLAFRIESMSGEPMTLSDGKFPALENFRLRVTPARDGRLYVIVVNPDRTQTLFLSDRPAPEAKVASNAVKAGQPLTFPGDGVPMYVTKGTERVLIVLAPAGAEVPPGLTGPSLKPVPPDVAATLAERASSAAADFGWGRRGDDFAVRAITAAAGDRLVVLDVNEISKSTMVIPDAATKP